MDMIDITCSIAIFLPLLLAVFLLVKRAMLSMVSRHFLDYSLIIVNLISFFCFFVYGIIPKEEIKPFQIYYEYALFQDFSFVFDIFLDNKNISYLIFASLMFLLVSIFAKLFFSEKKQFLFTRQRYFVFYSFLIFNTYLFFSSGNLILSLSAWILSGVLIFLFSYIDIFKNNVNNAISRNQKINFLGDFSFILGLLILYKNVILSNSGIDFFSLRLNGLTESLNLMYQLSSFDEFKISLFCFMVATATRFLILPFSCYNSFFANSSNLIYISNLSFINSIFGFYLLLNILPAFDFVAGVKYIYIYLAMSCFLSLFFILFEKNLKIIYGYLISAINALFFFMLLYFEKTQLITLCYLVILFVMFLVLADRFLKGKSSFNKRLISKQKGFALERLNIFFFEKLINKIGIFMVMLDEKLLYPCANFAFNTFAWITNKYQVRNLKRNIFKDARNIIVIFVLLVMFAILVSVIGDIECLKSVF